MSVFRVPAPAFSFSSVQVNRKAVVSLQANMRRKVYGLNMMTHLSNSDVVQISGVGA